MATGSVFSETLQSITTAKLSELSKKRAIFDTRHSETISNLEAQSDPLARVTTLLEGVKYCFAINTRTESTGSSNSEGIHDEQLEHDLRRLDRFLEQAKFDPSLTGRVLDEWEKTLLRHLDVQSQRYQYATLYGKLVTEWLSPNKEDVTTTAPSADVEMGDGFEEMPGKKRLEAREQFESSVFTTAKVDEAAIKQYLEDLFSDDEGSEGRNIRKALTALRESTKKFEAELARPNQFNVDTVRRSVNGLLKGDLFAGEQRTVLKDFQNNTIIISEIADVLNMRMSALSTWTWGRDGVTVEQRRKLNGRFDIFMHEDLLQAIFLQFIGVEWSVFFKEILSRFRRQAWKSNFKQISRIEKKRREYYLGLQETDEALARKQRRTYRKGYFLYHLLNSQDQQIEHKDGEEEAEFDVEAVDEAMVCYAASSPPTARLASKAARKSAPSTGAKRHRKIPSARLDDEESDDDTSDCDSTKKPMERKQDLLHLLTTEAALNKRLRGSFTAFRSVFDEMQNSLPHQAIAVVMEFFGISKTWLNFFHAYLEAPLRFVEDEESRTRKRGTPASHALSDVFSEIMLFCVDFSVNRRTNGTFLYRLADDFWYWSHDSSKTVTAWQEVQKFSETMNLPLSGAKSGAISIQRDGTKEAAIGDTLPTGRIRWGMMYFDPDTLRFKIDQKMVDDHIDELKQQLAAKESVFDWIHAWNAYANTFFASNFGKAAHCFGREHVDDILTTHHRIQRTVFGGKDVVQYLKTMIEERFAIRHLADGFLFFPVGLGGLELQNPFISPLLIRDSVTESPSKILDEFEENEKQQYQERKSEFDKGNEPESREDVDEPNWKPSSDADEFMSFEEYTKYREEFTTSNSLNHLLMAYDELMTKPTERSIEASPSVLQALEKMGPHSRSSSGITYHWPSMDAYWKWMAQLYGPEMIERLGGLKVVEPGLLPIGMVGLFRDQKVRWQG